MTKTELISNLSIIAERQFSDNRVNYLVLQWYCVILMAFKIPLSAHGVDVRQ